MDTPYVMRPLVRPRRLWVRWWLRFQRVLWIRKVYHVLGGSICIGLALWLQPPWLLIVATGSLIGWLLLEAWRRNDQKVHRAFWTLGRPLLRRRERMRLTGNVWTCLAMVIITANTSEALVVAGSLIGWTFGDPIAEIVGRLWPSVGISGRKTLAGTVACLLVCFGAYLLFFDWAGRLDWFGLALAGSLATTVAETFSGPLDDNLTIPLLTAAVLAFLL